MRKALTADGDTATPTLGFLVNPVAGMGGSVGLKGTDGPGILREAKRRGAVAGAETRAVRALKRLSTTTSSLHVLSAPDEMGATAARVAGLMPETVGRFNSGDSTAADTIIAARAMAERNVDLILFVGGDGTARDVLAAVGDRVPLLGVPAGVKMHSAVFGTSPENAGHLAGLFLARSPAATLREAEVMDLDEEAIREDRLSARLYGYAVSPFERRLVQNAKSGSRAGSERDLDAAARQLANTMQAGCLYILGPGTTTRRVAEALGLPSTLLGVDVILDGQLVGTDVDEQSLLRLMGNHEARIVVSILGGQGSLFGRGNQQISSKVIEKAGLDNILVLASLDKLIALDNSPLRVDTGDAELDTRFAGYIRVHTGADRSTILRIA
ncbi:ATP-NAD kinase family protein [Rhodococcus erythropolis]|uniref:ATP-NAD kinase family protein n=1 Tax=Rhodococcus erythropolis TaxID=1833 RepID=UPI003013B64C